MQRYVNIHVGKEDGKNLQRGEGRMKGNRRICRRNRRRERVRLSEDEKDWAKGGWKEEENKINSEEYKRRRNDKRMKKGRTGTREGLTVIARIQCP